MSKVYDPTPILEDTVDTSKWNQIERRKAMASLALTEKQKQWCHAYVEHYDANRAVREVPGYNKRSQSVAKLSHMNTTSPRCRAYVKLLEQDLASRVDLQPETLLRELLEIAMANMDDYAKWTGTTITLTDSTKLSREQKGAVAEVSITETPKGKTTKIKLFPKTQAIMALLSLIDEITKTTSKEERERGKVRIGEMNVLIAEGGLQNAKFRNALETVYKQLSGTNVALPDNLMSKVEKLVGHKPKKDPK